MAQSANRTQQQTEELNEKRRRIWREHDQWKKEAAYSNGQKRRYVQLRTGRRHEDTHGKLPDEKRFSDYHDDDPQIVAIRRVMWQDYGPWEDACPWDRAWSRHDRNRVIDAEPGLTDKERRTLQLYLDGRTLREIGTTMGFSKDTAARELKKVATKWAKKRLVLLKASREVMACWRQQTQYRNGNDCRGCCGQGPLDKRNARHKPCAKTTHQAKGETYEVSYCPLECRAEEPDLRGIKELPPRNDWAWWNNNGHKESPSEERALDKVPTRQRSSTTDGDPTE